jgi:steroid delta-isomerase-like uncharacterized protein
MANEVIERLLKVWHARDRESTLALFTDTFEFEGPMGMRLKGKEGAAQFYDLWTGAFPDNQVSIQHEYEAGNVVIDEATFSGTHKGNLMTPTGQTIPGTGRQVSVPFVGISILENGRIRGLRHYWDTAELMTQLGLMAEPAAARA